MNEFCTETCVSSSYSHWIWADVIQPGKIPDVKHFTPQ